ncbi:MAG: DNA-binding protein [Saprospirales bacterium]|nr:DNA-binding protein [Saprospirales bacterium]MBK8493371.1 DNA-binding protein [Saprospirales bacterium]
MVITFNELREIKHRLPTGSVSRIAKELDLSEQTVRNYFGGDHYDEGDVVDFHLEPGPNGGAVDLKDTRIWDLALKILEETEQS